MILKFRLKCWSLNFGACLIFELSRNFFELSLIDFEVSTVFQEHWGIEIHFLTHYELSFLINLEIFYYIIEISYLF